MKTIGFIDYYIDEWHSTNYPRLIRESTFKDKFEVTLAWDEVKKEGRKSIDEWCKEQKIGKAESIEQVVKECDCIVVLAPANPEEHERLADRPLRSGKPVYIDKTFAPTLAAAKRLFSKAEKYSTPMMSSSALRFGSALENALKNDIAGEQVDFAAIQGGGVFEVYAIHQIEMLVMLMGPGAQKVMQCGTATNKLMLVDYDNGRRASINILPGHPFRLSAQYGKGKCTVINEMADFFPRFVEGMLKFFDTTIPLVPKEQTLEVAALIEAGMQALTKPDRWVKVKQSN